MRFPFALKSPTFHQELVGMRLRICSVCPRQLPHFSAPIQLHLNQLLDLLTSVNWPPGTTEHARDHLWRNVVTFQLESLHQSEVVGLVLPQGFPGPNRGFQPVFPCHQHNTRQSHRIRLHDTCGQRYHPALHFLLDLHGKGHSDWQRCVR